jgi:hypothetical protein
MGMSEPYTLFICIVFEQILSWFTLSVRNIFINLLFTDRRYCKRMVMIKGVGSL